MNKKILRRSESYVGIHFDMHPREHEVLAGSEIEEQLSKVLEEIQPDYIQCTGKGHVGVAGYKSKAGTMAQIPTEDPMDVFRAVTKKYNTALYAHYSGLWDNDYIEKFNAGIKLPDNHPRKKLETNLISFYSNYLEEKMIPQLKEIAKKGLDGVWVDGDCWAAFQDYREEAYLEFKEKTGIDVIPKEKTEPYFAEWIDFFRGKYKEFLKKYVDELHSIYPDFQICTNWMYSMYAPEAVDTEVDFLSGDYPRFKSILEARSHARCFALQNKPWDLMAWGFNDTVKPAVMLCQEAAITLSLGGNIEFYYTQNRDCTIKKAFVKPFGEAVRFCRQRQKWLQNSKSASDIAIFLSKDAVYYDMIQPYTPRRDDVKNLDGALKCVLEAGFSADVVMDHQFFENKDRYKLIIVPEWGRISSESINFLKDFAFSGGSLLLVGEKTAQIFSDVTDITLSSCEQGTVFIPLENETVACSTDTVYRRIENGNCITKGATREEQGEEYTLAVQNSFGKGQIITVSADLFSRYNVVRSSYIRDYAAGLINQLNPKTFARVMGSHFVDLTIQEKDGKIYPNIVNLSGYAYTSEMVVYDEITPLFNFSVKVQSDKKPANVYLQPDGKKLEYEYADNEITVKIDRLDIHGIIDIDF